MELMTTSLDKAYKAVHESMKQKIPEDIIGKLAYSVGSIDCNCDFI